MNQSVSFELAKLLKEKGFNEEVRDYYSEQDGTFFILNTLEIIFL